MELRRPEFRAISTLDLRPSALNHRSSTRSASPPGSSRAGLRTDPGPLMGRVPGQSPFPCVSSEPSLIFVPSEQGHPRARVRPALLMSFRGQVDEIQTTPPGRTGFTDPGPERPVRGPMCLDSESIPKPRRRRPDPRMPSGQPLSEVRHPPRGGPDPCGESGTVGQVENHRHKGHLPR